MKRIAGNWSLLSLLKTKKLETVFLAVAVFFFMSVPSTTFASWTIEDVDAPHSFGIDNSRIIAMDKVTNYPHIVYGGDHLYHAYFDGTQWQIETIDNATTISYASIAIDSNNKIHASYVSNNSLKYATNASGAWSTYVIDSSGQSGAVSIALDFNDKVHISYQNYYQIKYANNVSGQWVIADVSVAGNYQTSIAVDSNGKVHISYAYNYSLYYATNISGAWETALIDDSIYSIDGGGGHSSIAVDSSNKVHISYASYPALKYATNSSGAWTTSIIDSSGDIEYFTSLAIDSNDKGVLSIGV